MHSKLKKLALITMPCVVSLALSACGGSSHHSSSGPAPEALDWAQSTGEYDTASIVQIDESTLPAILEGCEVPQGALIVMGDVFDQYASWIWNDSGNILGDSAAWPGEDFTNNVIASCSEKIRKYIAPEGKSMEGFSVIVNNGGNGKQTGDGNVFTQKKACLRITNESDGEGKIYKSEFVTARECGVSVEGLPAEIPFDVYVTENGTRVADGGTISINELSGKEETGYTVVTLLIGGMNVSAETTGKYWFGDNESSAVEFKNGEKIKIGANIKLNDGETKETELHVSYGEGDDYVTSSYKVEKSYSSKDDTCRLNKQEQTLGATYSSESTTFRIWSPTSSDVSVTVDGATYEMTKASIDCYSDVYEVKVDGDLVGKTYQFTVDGKNVRDPYGRMVEGSNSNANIVMDLSKSNPEGGWAESPELKNREDSIVYEVHVRDFTIDDTSNVDPDKKGRYLGMVQTGTSYNGIKTGIDHLKELGVTHVQLQPIYDYATCSDVDSQNNSCYNWGYDPWNYNVPEDRYSSVFGTDKYDMKIQEVKTMINELHKNGIRVIMDVVYNHTFDKSVFENITSKYYNKDDLSGCGNSIDAVNNMVWMMIRDSLDYWVTEYHIDGFRFDLVGAFSMKDYSDWGVYLNKQHPDANLVIYGEPWTGGSGDLADKSQGVRTGVMYTQDADAHVGAFNNRIRNCLKGSSDNADALGFIFDKLNDGWDDNGSDENDSKEQLTKHNKECVFMGMKAGVRHEDATGTDEWSAQGFSDPEQAVSYITAHDNLALRDKIEIAGIEGEEAKKLQVYAHSILMASQGISFIHGGEEFGRTKAAAKNDTESPIHNTYKTTTGANDFKWDLKAGEWQKVNDAYAAYIKMRKDHPAFRMTTAKDIFANVTLDEASTDSVVIININGQAVKDSWGKIKVVMNSTKDAATVTGIDGMTKVADGYTVGDDVDQNSSAAPQAMSIWITPADEADTTKEIKSMSIVGTTNSWNNKEPDSMTLKDDKWTSDKEYTLDEKSEFKFFTNGNTDWGNNDEQLGLCGSDNTTLKTNTECGEGGAGNVKPEKTGTFKIVVDNKTLEWSLVEVASEANDATETQGTATDTGANQKSYDSMFVRGNIISEGWDPEEMTYANGKWTSNAHNFVAGSQFKVLTNSSDWDTAGANGVFGVCGDDKSVLKANAHEDCGNDAGNVTPGKEGTFMLVIDDKTMAWELVSAYL